MSYYIMYARTFYIIIIYYCVPVGQLLRRRGADVLSSPRPPRAATAAVRLSYDVYPRDDDKNNHHTTPPPPPACATQ